MKTTALESLREMADALIAHEAMESWFYPEPGLGDDLLVFAQLSLEEEETVGLSDGEWLGLDRSPWRGQDNEGYASDVLSSSETQSWFSP